MARFITTQVKASPAVVRHIIEGSKKESMQDGDGLFYNGHRVCVRYDQLKEDSRTMSHISKYHYIQDVEEVKGAHITEVDIMTYFDGDFKKEAREISKAFSGEAIVCIEQDVDTMGGITTTIEYKDGEVVSDGVHFDVALEFVAHHNITSKVDDVAQRFLSAVYSAGLLKGDIVYTFKVDGLEYDFKLVAYDTEFFMTAHIDGNKVDEVSEEERDLQF